ncbi:SDR family NAD(P)-dependent oxidoreductase [Nocardiopsis xinjiangensis]|uniref:SDR family NAD(P)-dependent oxidoreductase n=1 Tax=Nocardiopsis xinjiangensis TaxID=124285 RepID=UPI000476D317|nr:SDR family oxidoreductase [Nocardiopsis xinjiangensis]
MSGWKAPVALVGARWALNKYRDRKRRPTPAERALDLAAWAGAGALLGVGASMVAENRRSERLNGRVAVVTGGTRGLGLQLAREFGAGGASVVVCGRSRDNLDQAVADLTGRGIDAHGVVCDVTDREQVRALIGETVERFGRLDIVVNNAGVMRVGPAEAMQDAHFTEAMDIMYRGPFNVAREALPHLRTTEGSLVNITSVGAYLTVPHLLPYSVAKHAWACLSEGLAAETGGTGVRVTTVVPGLMRTGSHRGVVFIGEPEREYAWFALLAGMPLLSTNADRAARRIATASARGQGFLVINPTTRIGMALHGLAPGTSQQLMRLTGRLLPSTPEHVSERTGNESGDSTMGRLAESVAALNERAVDRLNQDTRDRR